MAARLPTLFRHVEFLLERLRSMNVSQNFRNRSGLHASSVPHTTNRLPIRTIVAGNNERYRMPITLEADSIRYGRGRAWNSNRVAAEGSA